jgi:DNA-binding CsgD family transcriptional regulator
VELSSPLAKEWAPLLQHILEIKHGILPEASQINNDIEPRSLPQQQHRLSEGEIQELISAYKSGKTVYELAEQLSCHRATVNRHLKAKGVKMRMRPLTDEQSMGHKTL